MVGVSINIINSINIAKNLKCELNKPARLDSNTVV